MSKAGKRRMCPALEREITSAECGEGRGSRIECPSSCTFNPFAPDNYEQLLELETEVDNQSFERLSTSAMGGAARDPALRPKLIRLMKGRVRQCDERNLESGGDYDVNWMVRELGLDEILFPPPPRGRRPPQQVLEDVVDASDDDSFRFDEI